MEDTQTNQQQPAPENQSRADSWGTSVAVFAAGSLLWPAIFFLSFFAGAAVRAPANSWHPLYSAAWEETIDIVAIAGTYVSWVAPTLLAVLAGLGFLVTPTSDADSQSVLRPLPYVAALIGGFMLAWTVLGVVVLAVDPATADSDDGRQLWGLVFLTPISIVLALVLGRLDFRPAARRIEQLTTGIHRAESDLAVLRESLGMNTGEAAATTATAPRSTWKRPALIQLFLTIGTFVALIVIHDEPLDAAILAAVYVTALGGLVFVMVSLVQRWLIDARIATLTRRPHQSHLETVGAATLAAVVGLLVCLNIWFVFSGLDPIAAPLAYGLVFLAAMAVANPLTLTRSAWPAQVVRERERAIARMRLRLEQLSEPLSS